MDGNIFVRVNASSKFTTKLNGQLIFSRSGSVCFPCCAGTPKEKQGFYMDGAGVDDGVSRGEDDACFTPTDTPFSSWLDGHPSPWDADLVLHDFTGAMTL